MDNPVTLPFAGVAGAVCARQNAREASVDVRPRFRADVLGRLAAAAVLAGTLLCMSSGAALAAGERLDINTATVEQLTGLPGIGAAKAAAIVEERSRLPFTDVDDLSRVKGIGPALVADLRERVEVGKSDRN